MGNNIIKDINNRQMSMTKPNKREGAKKTEKECFKPRPAKINKNPRQITEVYKIEHSNLYHGGNGIVKEAYHRVTGVKKAIKIISKNENDPALHSTVMNEIRCMETLNHPSIAKITEYFEDNENYYIVMEFIEGRELFEEMFEETSFTEEKAARITQKMLTSLNHMHHRHILHRDVKPENIMINERQVKLIDFGSSTRFNKNEKLQEITGSCYYIAPEVLDGAYNEKCDIWSLGIILYIMLTGIIPYDGENDYEVLKQIRSDSEIFEKPEFETVSDDAQDLLRRMLRRNDIERISAKEALRHPWLNKFHWQTIINRETSDISLEASVLTNQLQANLCSYMLTNIVDKNVIVSLENLFLMMNTNGDGCLTRQDIQTFLRKDKSITASLLSTESLVNMIPPGRHSISFFEFSLKCINKNFLMKEDHLIRLFKQACQTEERSLSLYDYERFIGCIKIRDKLLFGKIVDRVPISDHTSLLFKEFKSLTLSIIGKNNLSSSFKMP